MKGFLVFFGWCLERGYFVQTRGQTLLVTSYSQVTDDHEDMGDLAIF